MIIWFYSSRYQNSVRKLVVGGQPIENVVVLHNFGCSHFITLLCNVLLVPILMFLLEKMKAEIDDIY